MAIILVFSKISYSIKGLTSNNTRKINPKVELWIKIVVALFKHLSFWPYWSKRHFFQAETYARKKVHFNPPYSTVNTVDRLGGELNWFWKFWKIVCLFYWSRTVTCSKYSILIYEYPSLNLLSCKIFKFCHLYILFPPHVWQILWKLCKIWFRTYLRQVAIIYNSCNYHWQVSAIDFCRQSCALFPNNIANWQIKQRVQMYMNSLFFIANWQIKQRVQKYMNSLFYIANWQIKQRVQKYMNSLFYIGPLYHLAFKQIGKISEINYCSLFLKFLFITITEIFWISDVILQIFIFFK